MRRDADAEIVRIAPAQFQLTRLREARRLVFRDLRQSAEFQLTRLREARLAERTACAYRVWFQLTRLREARRFTGTLGRYGDSFN